MNWSFLVVAAFFAVVNGASVLALQRSLITLRVFGPLVARMLCALLFALGAWVALCLGTRFGFPASPRPGSVPTDWSPPCW
ncbi:MAG: hypothetical protein U5R48_17425 [Gammaproteobacteria bacterium]|nr:hypothetical protein [Gammaproteobacteria bacterium]